ncbi:SusC/RagA family TonB-linked outer membrane protein [Sphingobacterium faecale]|nr:SusC/RagA family TonB-linked outer membrane protein [Sphingobacterium faecale]
MKLILIMMTAMLLHVHANVLAQRISLNEKKASLQKVMDKISKQTGYDFLVLDYKLISDIKDITIQIQKTPLKEALDELLISRNLQYNIEDNSIVIREARRVAAVRNILTEDVQQQQYELQGEVRSLADGQAIEGASVTVDKKHTLTDREGRFTISVDKPTGVLTIKHIGYNEQRVAYENTATLIEISLIPSDNILDEAVVIGYGITTKRFNTGSVASIGSKDIAAQPVSNPLAALQGRLPGVIVEQNNGLPGAKFSVQIRGRNSIEQGNNPLFLIDGIPFDVDNGSNFSNTFNVNSPFNMINPDEIERIDVLKDAEATSIYGSRGANGVVLITTKAALRGRLQFHVFHNSGISNVSQMPKVLSPEKFRELRREAFKNDKVTPTLGNARDLIGLDTNIVNDWGSIIMGKTAHSRNSSLSLEGGSDMTSFRLSGALYSEGNVYPGDDGVSRASFTSILSHGRPRDRLSISTGLAYSYGKTSQAVAELAENLNKVPYGFRLIDEGGRLVWDDATKNYGNPLSYLYQTFESQNHRFFPTLRAKYRFMSNLSLSLNTGLTYDTYDESSKSPKMAKNPNEGLKGSASFTNTYNLSWNIEPQVDYTWSVASGIDAAFLVGGTLTRRTMNNNQMSAINYENDALLGTIKGAGSVTPSDRYSDYRYQGGFARVHLNLKKQFLIGASARRDGSSRFAVDNRYAFFGALSGAWIFTEVPLLKESKYLSFGKLRASYGTTGNDQIGDYMYLDNYKIANDGYNGISLQPMRLYNPTYGWEQFRKLDVGLELSFWDSRLSLNADYYKNTSDNQLVQYSLPDQTGFASILKNFPGKVRNQGFELAVTGHPLRTERIRWTSGINISWHRNKLLAFPDLESSTYNSSYAVGQPLDIMMGFRFEGVDPQTGNYQVTDTNGDGTFNYLDYVPIGHFRPRFYGGLNNTLSIGSFSMDIFFQFVQQNGRHPIYSSLSPLGSGLNVLDIVDDRWRKEGDVASYAKATRSFNATRTSYQWASNSDAVITDASYLRLKNINLMYSVPSSICSKLGVKRLTLSLRGQNLLTLTKYMGLDPEVQSLRSVPPLRIWNFGANLTF